MMIDINLLKDTFDSLREAVTIHDRQYNIVYSNKAAKEVFGLLPGGKMKCFMAFHASDCPPSECPSCKSWDTKSEVVFDLFVPHSGKHLEIKTIPQIGSKGEVTHLVHLTKDITLRREAEIRLTESERKLRETTESLPEIYFDTDLQGNLRFVNRYAYEKTGYTEEDLSAGLSCLALIAPEDRERAGRNFARVASGSRPDSNEYRMRRKDGTTFPVTIRARAVLDEAGRPLGTRGIAVDLSEIRQIEEELQASELRYRTLAETASLGIQISDLTGRIVMANAALHSIFGAPEGSLLSKHVWDFVSEGEDPEHLKVFYLELVKEKPAPEPYVVHRRRLDDREIQVRIDWNYMHDASGKVTGICSIISDVTALRDAEKSLKRALADKGLLIREVHHRVKNHLTIIQSLLNLQSGNVGDSGSRTSLMEAQCRVKSIAMVHDLLHKAHDVRQIDAAEYVTKLATYLRHQCESLGRGLGAGAGAGAGAAPEAAHGCGVGFHLEVDEMRLDVELIVPLGLILNELITNALKYAFKDTATGRIEIRMKKTGPDKGLLSVSDDGAGLPEGFDPSRSASMGMMIVNSLVRQIDGNFKMSEGPGGRGLEVSVEFPIPVA